MKDELEKLAADVAEQARYASELGLGGLEVDLPAERAGTTAPRLPKLPARTAAADEPIELYVPDTIPTASVPKGDAPTRASRLSLLESSKLSNLQSMRDKPEALSTPKSRDSMSRQPIAESTAEPLVPAREVGGSLTGSSETVDDVRRDIGDCRRCGLCEERTQVVHSTGILGARLMFVGEAPGADEDQKGEPFVGRAGQLLTKIIEAIGFRRGDVFIGNINRCRPPGNRAPTLAEAESCKPFLLREIAIVRPAVIVVLGNTACQNLLETKVGISKLRGNFQDYFGVKVMPTFHPAYLLRDPNKKREVWEDMKKVRDYLNTL